PSPARCPRAPSASARRTPTSSPSSTWPCRMRWRSRSRTCSYGARGSGRAAARVSTAPARSASGWRSSSAGRRGASRRSSRPTARTWRARRGSGRRKRVGRVCYRAAHLARRSDPRLTKEVFMKRWAGIVLVLTTTGLLASPAPSMAKTEIQWWHAMTAVLGERVNEIAATFNASQNEYEVKAVYKGSYPDTLNAAIAAYRAEQANGFDGLATRLQINGAFGVKMLELLQRGAREGWFVYNGRLNKAEANMGGGECGIFLSSSAYIGNLTRASEGKFVWGTGPLPRLSGYPQGNSIIGGATLWVMKGAKPEEYKGVAQFFKYLASTANQAWWAGLTGYLPLTNAAVKAMESSGHFQKNP